MPMTDAELQKRQQWERAYTGERTGPIKRRYLSRLLNNITAVGPTNLHPSPPPAPSADEVARKNDELTRKHREMVNSEIAALDKHADIVRQHIEALESSSRGASSFMLQEMKREHRLLSELRQMLEIDRDAGRIRIDKNRNAVDDHARAYIRFRASELREQAWAAAEREARAGEHRAAVAHRIDALRARMLAEFEAGHRSSLPGYSSAWA